jgi:hypothetical protein
LKLRSWYFYRFYLIFVTTFDIVENGDLLSFVLPLHELLLKTWITVEPHPGLVSNENDTSFVGSGSGEISSRTYLHGILYLK